MQRMAERIGKDMPWQEGLQALVMLLLVRVRLMDAAAPLAAAWLFAGGNAAWKWTGLALGAWMDGGAGWWLLPAGSGLLLAAWHGLCGGKELPDEGRLLAAGGLAVLDAALHTGPAPGAAVVWLACGMAALVAALLMGEGLPGRVTLGFVQAARMEQPLPVAQEHWRTAGSMLLAVGVTAGAARAFGADAGLMAAAMVLAPQIGAVRPLTALLLTAVLCIAGVEAAVALGVAVTDAALSLLRNRSRAVRAAGALAAAGLWYGVMGDLSALRMLALLPGAVLGAAGDERPSAADVRRIGNRREEKVHGRLEQLAQAVEDMAQLRPSGPDPPREDMLLPSLRARLCSGCVRYERCWNGRAGEGSRLLCELITRSVNGTLPERVPPDMMRRCLRASIIPERLYGELNRFSRMRERYMSCMDGAKRAQLTLDTVSRLLRGMAQAQQIDVRRVESALRRSGLHGIGVSAVCDGLVLTRSGGWPGSLRGRAISAAGRALGVRYGCEDCAGREMVLSPVAAIDVRIGWDGVAAEGSRSGDSVHIGPLDDRRELVVISDGMGVGDTAAGESRRAVAAVVRLLRGGIPPERAALLANQLLLAQGSAERYATLDLCVIDKVRMEATWVKMAACDSYLLREHDCSVISGGQLPMGIVAEATPQVTTHHLRSGDVIVMGTDGAMEGLDPDTARRCLVARRRTEAAQLAVHMRSAGQARRVHADDQTLAVICISQREKKRAAGI